MMRARYIKPGLYKNDELAECSIYARWLFTGLWGLADREGRLEDRPKRIKAEVLPYDDVDVDALLNDLAGHDFIHRYEVDGERYIQVANFTKHQRPHSSEVDSVIPPPTRSESTPRSTKVNPTVNQGEPHGQPTQHSRARTENGDLIPDSLNPDTRESTATDKPPPRPPRVDHQMWEAFSVQLGSAPTTKSERGKWNGAIKELIDADIMPEHVPRLVSQYRKQYGPEIDCSPRAIANNLSKLTANGVRGSPRPVNELSPELDALARERGTGRYAQNH